MWGVILGSAWWGCVEPGLQQHWAFGPLQAIKVHSHITPLHTCSLSRQVMLNECLYSCCRIS